MKCFVQENQKLNCSENQFLKGQKLTLGHNCEFVCGLFCNKTWLGMWCHNSDCLHVHQQAWKLDRCPWKIHCVSKSMSTKLFSFWCCQSMISQDIGKTAHWLWVTTESFKDKQRTQMWTSAVNGLHDLPSVCGISSFGCFLFWQTTTRASPLCSEQHKLAHAQNSKPCFLLSWKEWQMTSRRKGPIWFVQQNVCL